MSKPSHDWRDSLRALSDQLPEGSDIVAAVSEEPSVRQPRLDIGLESKGRAGKKATLITGWVCPEAALRSIASDMKTALGVGGSARGGDILIQGDRRADVKAWLDAHNYKSRLI